MKPQQPLRNLRFGCLTGTGLIAGLIAAIALTVTAFASGGAMYSPGQLNAASGPALGGVSSHADLAEDCQSCHTAPWEPDTMQDRCLNCHTDIVEEMKSSDSIHGGIMELQPEALCRDCHTEHHGSDALLTVLNDLMFPHESTGFSLKGHRFKALMTPFECEDCHGADVTQMDTETCGNCHAQKDMQFMVGHIFAFGKNCLNCHDGVDSFGSDFNHNLFPFALTGKHATVSCAECHINSQSIDALRVTPQDCASCHEKDEPHNGKLGTDCASCHFTDGWKPSTFDHDRSVFHLEGAHAQTACSNCHLNQEFKGTPQDCFSCHEKDDHHKGQLGNDCASCHVPKDWKTITFDHNTSAFKLTGKHAQTDCVKCHVNDVFKGTPQDCFSCHGDKDPHKGKFGKQCNECHTTDNWKVANFNHARTGFSLIGKHAQTDCAKCHVNGIFAPIGTSCFACHAKNDVHNGTFGKECATCHTPTGWRNIIFDHNRTSFPLVGSHASKTCKACHANGVFRGTPKNCFSCHAKDDRHNGQYGAACESCHKPTRWSDVNFDHSVTAFPLVGSHTAVACSSCHVNGVFKGTPKNCFSCHAKDDHHNGQFGTVCDACHKPTRWSDVNFDHNTTAFPLTGSHTNVKCASCHVNGVFKGTPKDCYSCHAGKDKHNGQFGTNCAACHVTSKWSNVNFDHNTTAFPLVGKHTKANCASCHVNGVFKGTPKNCYACHSGNDKHNGQYGTSCESCHSPTGWSDVTFDHNATAFPLTGQHKQAACTQCHTNGQYKGLPSTCVSCHNEPAFHAGALGTDCKSCHDTSKWTNATLPSHPQHSGENMLKHHGATCRTCHVNTVNEFTCLACHDSNNP